VSQPAPSERLQQVLARIDAAARAAGRPRPRLLAVSKLQPAEAVAALAAAGQLAFGENYVQEGAAKRQALDPALDALLEWHLIGHLQSNKAALAAAVAAQPRLALRGLMAIPVPHPDPEDRRPAFRAMKQLFDELAARHPAVDTLSMGMSDDFAVAIAEGATLVRIGTALFGPRPPR